MTVYLDATAWRQLKMLGVDQDRTTQALIEEAINLLFRAHRKNRSA